MTSPLILPPVALPADHKPVKAGRIGVLLVNLGSPDAPDVPFVLTRQNGW